jgi:hypothetical protein
MSTPAEVTLEEVALADEAREGNADLRPGLGARPSRVGKLLTLLATTSRSFLLYDARNDAIRSFLSQLVEGFAETLREEHAMRVEVRPFEIAFEGQPVYLNRDRERSLAFRLYRDGVRALTFHEGFGLEELARLLEILSIRYSGVHQHEDDTVTLLWKGGFQFLEVVAVEGLTPEAGDADAVARTRPSQPAPFLPEDADLPLPAAPAPSQPAWVEVEEGARQVLRDQVFSAALPEDALRLLTLLARGLEDPVASMPFAEVIHLAEEMRDLLLSVESLVPLLDYVHLLRRLAQSPSPSWDPDRREAVVALLVSFGSDRALRKLMRSIPAGERVMPHSLVELLNLVCPDPFTAVAEALALEEDPAGRAVARQLLEHYGKRQGQLLRQRFAEAHGRVAADLLRSLARMEDGAAPAFLARQCAHPDLEVREEALWHLEHVAYTAALGHAFLDAFRRTEGDHRRRVLALIEKSRDRRFVEPLVALLDGSLAGPAEALEVGGVLGRLEGLAGLTRWQVALRPAGRLLGRRLPGSVAFQVAAAAAVAQIPGTGATQVLAQAHDAAISEVRSWIEPLLAERHAAEERISA